MRDPEPHYSGGICLDHENTNFVYFSKPVGDIFEIFKAQTTDNGDNWKMTAITSNSNKDNVRPFVVREVNQGNTPVLLWMYNDEYIHYKNFKSQIKVGVLK